MRLTFNSIRDGLDAINTASEQFASAQWQVSSGRRIRTSSDDPLAAQSAVNDQAEIATLDSYSRASDSAVSRLAMLDSVLGDVVDKITQALTAAQSARGSIGVGRRRGPPPAPRSPAFATRSPETSTPPSTATICSADRRPRPRPT